MKYLIVNADDLGLSPGVNRGIIEAHEHGIVTSTSLMVDEPASEEGARLALARSELSVGLHLKITDEYARPAIDVRTPPALSAELERQIERFERLAGREPTHLDSHHNIHLVPELAQSFAELAESRGLMLRGSPIRYVPSFYGQWDGETHLEQIGAGTLVAIVGDEAGEGITELGCHPGYVDPTLESTYSAERETELRTLCLSHLRTRVEELGVKLVSSTTARRLVVSGHLGE
jgi:predicted glycoside hydrolase/deacetylase ChbG (UPF0249 family)